jgi:alkylhydroperoxidase/carboxymuconolactone decarboxylase family protein YurZ
MHPVIARFLDVAAALNAIDKSRQDDTLDADEAALVQVVSTEPELAKALAEARGKKNVPPTVQQQLIVLATKAATRRLEQDPGIGPRIASAISALKAQGASDEEAQHLVSQAVLEEAFGFAEDPDVFDKEFLAETLDSLVHLAALNQDLVDEWNDAFTRRAKPEARPLRLKVAETLLSAAWGEGPQPINPEHLDDALDRLADELTESELTSATGILGEFLGFLADKHVVGPVRLARLTDILESARRSGELRGDDDEEDDEGDDQAEA